jgi:DedD protein
MPPARAVTAAPASAPPPLAPDAPAPRDDAAAVPAPAAASARTEPARIPPVASAPAPTPAPAAKKPAEAGPAGSAADAARARALLDGKAVAAGEFAAKIEPAAKPAAAEASEGRFVVQVGAFAEAAAARETRLKVAQLGLKTYTQVAETQAGRRIRVRVGPFASREEADKALAKAKAAGLPGVVLTL